MMGAAPGRTLTGVRVLFGVIWGVAAYKKWQPAFLDHLERYFSAAAAGQPGWLAPWFVFWVRLVSVAPHSWAVLTAVTETGLAVLFILGLARQVAYLLCAGLRMGTCITAEGFGGPYGPRSTDIDSSLLYAVVAAALGSPPRPRGTRKGPSTTPSCDAGRGGPCWVAWEGTPVQVAPAPPGSAMARPVLG
jgi:thiosulfate dehydrogenase [quinone] large subunit